MDPTGGFKCFRRRVLETITRNNIRSNGYAFQIELSYQTWLRGYRVREIPITFADRTAGQSKMSGHIVREALWMVWAMAAHHGFRRRPFAKA
jgi:dolichol-phosphate mannosyltransferase